MTTSSRFDIASTLGARALAMIGPFGVSILTARLLGPEDRGRYFYIVALAQIAAQLAGLGLHASNSYIVAARQHLLGRLLVNSLVVAAVLGPLATLLVISAARAPELLGHRGQTGTIILMAVLIAPLNLAVLYLTNLAVGIGRVQLFNGLTILSGALALLAAAIVALMGGDVLAYLGAAAAALAVTSAVGLAALLQRNLPSPSFDVALFQEGIAYAFRAYLAALLGLLQLRIGVVALQHNASLADVGQFSIAAQIADALILVPSTVSLLLFPNLVRARADQRWQATLTTLTRVFLLMLALCVALAMVLPYAIPLIFGPAYDAATWLTIGLLPTVLLVSLQSVVSQFVAAEGYPWGQVRAWLIGFLIAAVLGFALTGPYAGFGVASALLVSNVAVFLLLLREVWTLRTRLTPR